MESKKYISPLTKVHVVGFKVAQIIGPNEDDTNESKRNNLEFEEDGQVVPNKTVWSLD